MRAEEIAALRELLLQRRSALLAEGTVPIPMAKPDAVTKPDDDEAPLTEMTQVIASNRNRARTAAIAAIADGLRRMIDDPDEYGLCKECDATIPQARLVLMPQAYLCATCQAEQELANKPGARKHITDYR